ncbi:MAG: hypothetical protein PVI26_11635 [Chitinispirillia bacterium]|jgi:sugar lactone lactonase YvrE
MKRYTFLVLFYSYLFFFFFIPQPNVLCGQFEELSKEYDLLSTVAGKGKQDGGNCWLEKFEGGNAIEAELSRPHFAMADKIGNIYIADKEAHAIRKVTPEGRITTYAGTNRAGDGADKGISATDCDLSSPNGLWVKQDGTVFILDLGNSKIRRVSPGGEINTILHDEKGFGLGRGLWVSDDEQTIYYSCTSEIRKWTASSGKSISYAGGFSGLSNIIADPSGYIVATDRSLHRVYRIISEDTKKVIAGSGLTSGGTNGGDALDMGLNGVRAVWFYPDGSFLVGTHEGSQVWYIDTIGTINLFLDGMKDDDCYAGDGENFLTSGKKISEVRSVSMDIKGNVLIVENDQGHIRKVCKRSSGIIEHSFVKKLKAKMYVVLKFGKIIITINNEHVINNCEISLYDIMGKEFNRMTHKLLPVGKHRFIYDNGLQLGNGCYVVHMQSDNTTFMRQNMIVTRIR